MKYIVSVSIVLNTTIEISADNEIEAELSAMDMSSEEILSNSGLVYEDIEIVEVKRKVISEKNLL